MGRSNSANADGMSESLAARDVPVEHDGTRRASRRLPDVGDDGRRGRRKAVMRSVPLRAIGRYAWVAPASLVGLAVAAVAGALGARARIVDGVLEVAGGRLAPALARANVPFCAITLGHVVLGLSVADLDRCRAHERVHVRQYERWGVAFFPLYLASSLAQRLRGGDPYFDNAFEREARERSAAPT
jgi:hypothetical protein